MAKDIIHTHLTNGRVFAAAIDDVVFLPNGRAVTMETAEDMGFEECNKSCLSDACRIAMEKHCETLELAQKATKGGDSSYKRYKSGTTSRLIYHHGKVVGRKVWV